MTITIWAISLYGNHATRRQVAGLAENCKRVFGDARIEFITPIAPEEAKHLDNNTIVTWTDLLTRQQLTEIKTVENRSLEAPWPHLVISCRPEVAAIALSIKQASEGRTKIVHIQDPNDKLGIFNFDCDAFDAIIVQPQETLDGGNVIVSQLPLHDLTQEKLSGWRAAALEKFPQYQDATIILLGGSDEHVGVMPEDFTKFGIDIISLNGPVIALSSRRTSEEQIQAFKAVIVNCPHIMLDPPGFSYDMALATGSRFIFDASSGSMGAEASFTGKQIQFYTYRGKLINHPQLGVWHNRGLNEYKSKSFD